MIIYTVLCTYVSSSPITESKKKGERRNLMIINYKKNRAKKKVVVVLNTGVNRYKYYVYTFRSPKKYEQKKSRFNRI